MTTSVLFLHDCPKVKYASSCETRVACPLECEAWVCGKLRIALTIPFRVIEEVPTEFISFIKTARAL